MKERKGSSKLLPPEVTDKLNNERAELESHVESERNKFKEVTQRLLRDAKKNKPKLLELLRSAFLEHTKIQISFTKPIDEACQRLMPVFKDSFESSTSASIENDGSSPPHGAPPPGAPPAGAPPPASAPPAPPMEE